MPWRVGLDEAGYGPNLGPLVVASTACHVPGPTSKCLWRKLSAAVRKAEHADDGRLLIDDSKKVNDGVQGLARLEAGVLAALAAGQQRPGTMLDYLTIVTLGDSLKDLGIEPWFIPADPLPAAQSSDVLDTFASKLADASSSADLEWGPIHSVVVPAPRFNQLLAEWRVKSGVLASAVILLLQSVMDLPGDEPIQINVDKLGGRHFYAPLLNEAFAGAWINVVCEGPERCDYTIVGLKREVSVRFEPRADGTHLNVALASMAAKYLRELCMGQFNRYWLSRVPGLQPTAGYPTDAGRFFKAIRPVIVADGIDERAIWRTR